MSDESALCHFVSGNIKITMIMDKAIIAVLSHQKFRQLICADILPEIMGPIIKDPM